MGALSKPTGAVAGILKALDSASQADSLLVWRQVASSVADNGEQWQLAYLSLSAFFAAPGYPRTKAGHEKWNQTEEGRGFVSSHKICGAMGSWREAMDVIGYRPAPNLKPIQDLALGPEFDEQELREIYWEYADDASVKEIGISSYRTWGQKIMDDPDRKRSRVPTSEAPFERIWTTFHNGAVICGIVVSLNETSLMHGPVQRLPPIPRSGSALRLQVPGFPPAVAADSQPLPQSHHALGHRRND